MSTRPPWYLLVWGWLLLVVAVLDLMGSVFSVSLGTTDHTLLDVVPSLVVLAAGVGLLMESRWGWAAALCVATAGISLGTWIFIDGYRNGWDLTLIALPWIALFILLIPGALLMISLLTPRSRSWLRRRP